MGKIKEDTRKVQAYLSKEIGDRFIQYCQSNNLNQSKGLEKILGDHLPTGEAELVTAQEEDEFIEAHIPSYTVIYLR